MARAAIALLGILLACPVLAQDYSLKVGRDHPDFTLPELQTGKPVSLSDFRGKKVLLIHFASW